MADQDAQLREAVSALVTKLDVILPLVSDMCMFISLHGGAYSGPSLEKELLAVKKLLAVAP